MNSTIVRKWSGTFVIMGVLGFTAIVIALHLVQPGYDPIYQLMSELALGNYRSAMLIAFLSLGSSVLAIALGIGISRASKFLVFIHCCAAAGLIGAGVFPLGTSSEIHMAMITGAFVLLGLAMVLFPSTSGDFSIEFARTSSWSLAGAMSLSVTLGSELIPMGIAQRMAVLCLLLWLLLIGWKLIVR